MGLFCVRERRRRWRTWRRNWRLDWSVEEEGGQTWEEMLFGGGGTILGFHWNEAMRNEE